MLAGTKRAVRDLVLAHERVNCVVLLELMPLVASAPMFLHPLFWMCWFT
jgi:hypothetical protein